MERLHAAQRPRRPTRRTSRSGFDMTGDLTQAHRWVQMGVDRLQLGFPPDELDELRP